MSTETLTEPEVAEAPPQWPPVAHIVRREDLPARAGTRALCGAKLMGIDLDGSVRKAECKKCVEIMRREMNNA